MVNNNRIISKFGDPNLPCWEWNVRQGGLMDQESAKANLADLKRVFDKHNIKFCLIFGTLLGAIRDKNFIPWDSDTDILCFREDYRKIDKALDEMESIGFYCPRRELPMLDHYLIRNGEKIDINWVLDNGHNELLYADWIKWDKKFFQFPLPTISFNGIEIAIPSNTKELLQLTYGDTWETPIQNKKGFKG